MINFADSTHSEFWYFLEHAFTAIQEDKRQLTLVKLAQNLDSEMLKSKGDTREEKAKNYWIKEESEEKILATQITRMQDSFARAGFKSVKALATAMAFLQRFYLKESVFIYDME